MMNPMDMVSGLLGDGTGVGVEDGGKVIAINGMVAWVKDEIQSHHQLDGKINWAFPFLPYLCAFAMSYLDSQDLIHSLKGCVLYGTAATAAYRLHKDTTDHL